MCEAREQRGIQIAAFKNIVQKGQVWIVPSQTDTHKKYTVHPDEQQPYCSCPDFELRGCNCKHIFAVRCVIKREQHADGSVTETATISQTIQRKTYPQKWAEYNQAQTNEKDLFQSILRNLCDQIPEDDAPAGRGRPRTPMGDSIFMTCFKVYSTVSGRRFMCDLNAATQKGYLTKLPHYNAIFKALEREELTPILMDLIQRSAKPLASVESDFAIDSSGFSSSKFVRWFDEKYGNNVTHQKEREWLKAHVCIGTVTQVITAIEVTEKSVNDCPLLPALLRKTAEQFDVKEVSADKGYISVKNFEAIAAIGADAYIAFRKDITGAAGGTLAKCFHYFQLYREEFLQSYHKRSNVESAFSMIKRKFGDSVRSKTPVAMKNELLCKVLCHNICCLISAIFELNIDLKMLA